jgi:hypothetical protein
MTRKGASAWAELPVKTVIFGNAALISMPALWSAVAAL